MDERRTTELEDFLRSCRSERRLAPLTCSAYERDVSACLGYLQGECIEDLAEEQKRRPAMASQARTTAALKSFFRFLVDEERLVRDPALPLRTPGKQEALPDVLTMGELQRLLAQLSRDELWERHFPRQGGARSAPTRLMTDAGLRRSELLGPEWDDVDLSRRLLRVRKAKGGRQRTIPIHPALVPLLAEAGVNERKRVTPHTLRHVFASELLHAGATLSQIQELLGHKHLDSTQRYTRVNAHELRGAIQRLRWVGERPARPAPSQP
jgi:site-specific recombinase XerD